uniref:Expressed protein n=2 Tax=Schizophyllum commune (strain H4-8 / FGSC 9210) TaxID=578458 RepID=D8QB79_SCHCM
MLCAHLRAPALQHLILDVPTWTFDGGLAEFETVAFEYLYSLVPPITSLTLRNMDNYDYREPHLGEIFTHAPKLRKITAIVIEGASKTELSMYTELFRILCCGDGHPELPQLTEVELWERVESVDWSVERVDLVRLVLQSRGSPSNFGPARLKRLRIRSPFVFSDSATAEDWANVRGSDGEHILDVDVQFDEEEGPVEWGIDVAAALGDLE